MRAVQAAHQEVRILGPAVRVLLQAAEAITTTCHSHYMHTVHPCPHRQCPTLPPHHSSTISMNASEKPMSLGSLGGAPFTTSFSWSNIVTHLEYGNSPTAISY